MSARDLTADSDHARLLALYDLKILDTANDERFDRIIAFAAQIFRVPIAGLALVADDRVWFKSKVGFEANEIPITNSFEKEIAAKGEILVVPNARETEFKNDQRVINAPGITSYVGVPIKIHDFVIGVLFLADRLSRQFDHLTINALENVARWTQCELESVEETHSEELLKAQEELNRKNRDLQVSNAQRQVILESLGDGIIVINDKGAIIFANKQVETMTGWKEEELLGKLLIHSLKLVNEKKEEIIVTAHPIRLAMYQNQRVTTNQYYCLRKDESSFAASITATPIHISNVVIGGVYIIRDITHEKEIDRMKTEFISLASHQLRTPLSAMKWFSEMLIDGDVGPLTDEQKEVTQNIYDSNERMIELVSTLLNISRIESGRIIIEPKLTDLKKLVEDVVLELKPKLAAKKHQLVVSVHEGLPEILLDSKLVRHVYTNLLTNAIKYTPENGQITILISKSGNEVISQISDNGYGIPKDQQEKVFSKFFRAKNIVGVETDGTGLGLYLAKAIVDSSGGKIWFESITKEDKPADGKTGTSFWLILPLHGMQGKKGEVVIDS
jgi:PAS domain S-box-containing protein